MLSVASEVYIYFPGGFGTLDEFFEILTLVHTKKIAAVPIILVGRDYWTPLTDWFHTTLAEKYRVIGAHDMSLVHIVDSAEEAHALIQSMDGTLAEDATSDI